MASPPKEPMRYLDWFADQYDVGLPSPETAREAIAYLQALIDTAEPERRAYLMQAASCLRSLEVMVRTLRQYDVRMPHG
jgi:hypothetical protein